MQFFLRWAAVLLAIIAWGFAACSLLVAIVEPTDRGTMLLGTVLLVGIGAFFWWRSRSLRPR